MKAKIFFKKSYYLIIVPVIIFFFIAYDNYSNKKTGLIIKVASVKRNCLVRNVKVIGTVVPTIIQTISSENSGIVKEIFIREGQKVSSGQKLIRIDSSLENEKYLLLEQKVIEARLEYEQTEKEFKRLERLYELNEVTEKQLDELKNRINRFKELININQKLLDLQNKEMDKILIRSPMTGMILFNYPLQIGMYIRTGTPVLSVVSLDSFQIEAQLNQDDALMVKLGQKVFINENKYGKPAFSLPGKITFIAPEIKRGMMKILVQLIEKEPLKLGSAVKVVIPVLSQNNTLIVPIEAVRIFNERKYIFTIEKGVVAKPEVVIGNNNHSFVEIIEGERVIEGQKVIISNFDQVNEGMKINRDIITDAGSIAQHN